MPNRKFKVPKEGSLVLAKGTKFRLLSGKRETYFSKVVEVGEPLMYLGCESKSLLGISYPQRYVYKFLAYGKVLRTQPMTQKPKQWLSRNVRLVKGKKKGKKK